MLEESERFRVIKESTPKIAEEILRIWGTPELVAYINRVIDDARGNPAPGLTAKVELALYGLRKEHEREYGRRQAVIDGHSLAENEHFRKVDAQHKRIAAQLVKLWGGPDASAYINTLLQDTRGGTRQGFPPEVAKALFKLLQIHDRDYPAHALKVGDIWTGGKPQ